MDGQPADGAVLLQRALFAYHRPRARQDPSVRRTVAPAIKSYTAEYLGKRYVVLEDFDGVLAVYRVRNDGILKVLRRWPAEIEEGRMTYACIVTAEAPGATQSQVRVVSNVLAQSYIADASMDGSLVTARLKISRNPSALSPVFTADQAESAARRYVTIAAELARIEPFAVTQVTIL